MTQWQMYAQVPALNALGLIRYKTSTAGAANNFFVALTNASYPLDLATTLTHSTFAGDVSAYEITTSDSSYTVGGKPLTGLDLLYDSSEQEWYWTANTVQWTDLHESAGTIGCAVLYESNYGRVIAYADVPDTASTGRNCSVVIPAEGLLRFRFSEDVQTTQGLPDTLYEVVNIAGVL